MTEEAASMTEVCARRSAAWEAARGRFPLGGGNDREGGGGSGEKRGWERRGMGAGMTRGGGRVLVLFTSRYPRRSAGMTEGGRGYDGVGLEGDFDQGAAADPLFDVLLVDVFGELGGVEEDAALFGGVGDGLGGGREVGLG